MTMDQIRPAPPMLARPRPPIVQAMAPAFAQVAEMQREVAALQWLGANDPDGLRNGWAV